MMCMHGGEVRGIGVCREELSLDLTLPSGQAFRWQRSGEGEWTGTIGRRLFTLKQTNSSLVYCTHSPSEGDKEALEEYLRLQTSCVDLYQEWSKADGNFKMKAAKLKGVRLLRQDPVETLIAFICSSNNNIPRISLMLNRLCEAYGEPVGRCGGEMYHSFPALEAMVNAEAELRGMGFGYRAKYVQQTAKMLVEDYGGEDWLYTLRAKPYKEVWSELQVLPGVGPKVADCVCLMGLDKLEAVPVDTHVHQVAVRDYGMRPTAEGKGFSHRGYQQVGDLFRSVFGDKAGWAQAVLFAAELHGGSSEASGRRRRTVTEARSNSKRFKT